MPNITEFDAGNLSIRPSETGVESFAAAGRRAGAFYNQAAESKARLGAEVGQDIRLAGDAAVAYADHQQINAGADHGATLFANLTDSWNQTSANADVHDPTVAKKWREEQLEPALAQFSQGFTTQKSQDWANRFVNTQREHFFTKTEADMSSMAGIAVRESVNNAVTKYSNAAVSDPSSVDASVKLFKQNLDDVIAANPNIKGPDAARVRLEVAEKGARQIVQAGAMGAILNSGDPEAAATAWAKKYPDYVSGAEELQLARAAKTQSRANLAYSKQAEAYQRQIDRDNVEAARNDIWSKNVTVDPQTGRPTINPDFFKRAVEIPMKYPNAPNATETARTLLDWGEGVQNGKFEKNVTNPAIYGDLNSRLLSADNPTTEIQVLKAEVDKGLTHFDGEAMRSLIKVRDEAPIKDPIFKDTIQAVKDNFIFSPTGDDPSGSQAFARFMQSFFPEYQKEARAGTLKPNALNMRDPTSLISQSIAATRGSLQDTMRTPAATKVFAPPPDWFSNGRGEFADPAGNIYDKDGKPTGRKINANALPNRWPTAPISQ